MAKMILVTDDEPHIVKMIENRLKKSGYDVRTAHSGEAALGEIRKEKPDLMILDVIMPPPNGYQLCRILKEDPNYKNIPIILLTAKASESDQFWGMESGANAYITKPYDPEDLLGRVREFLGG